MDPLQHTSTEPRRRGAAATTWLWLVGVAAAAGLWASAFQTGAGESAVVLRFGDPSRVVLEPGLHFKLPAPFDTVHRIDMRTHVLDPEPAEFLTRDQRNLEVDAFVAWRVAKPRVFITSLQTREGADARIEQVLQAAINDVLTKSPLEHIVWAPAEGDDAPSGDGDGTAEAPTPPDRDLAAITEDIRALVAAGCAENGYGVEIVYTGFERVTFHSDNMPSIERSMQEERMRVETKIRSAGREAAAEIAREAKLEGNRIVAEARAEAERIRGMGLAEAKRIESEAYQRNPELFELLTTLEILEPVLRGQTIVLDSDHFLLKALSEGPPAAEPDAPRDE